MRGEKTAKIDRLAFPGKIPLFSSFTSLSLSLTLSLSLERSIVKIVVAVLYIFNENSTRPMQS